MVADESQSVVTKSVKIPRDLALQIDECVRLEDTDFAKWARRALRHHLAACKAGELGTDRAMQTEGGE